jgi:FAD/FMN-containing dehydrogenase
MKLYPLPAARALIWLNLPDVSSAVDRHALAQTVFAGAQTASELISATTLSLVRQHLPEALLPTAAGPWPEAWALMMEVSAHDADFLQALLCAWQRACATAGVNAGYIATAPDAQAQLWAIRKGLAESQKREGLAIKHDVGLQISRIPQFIDEASAALQKRFPGIRIVAFGHIGDGNLHFNLSYADPVKNVGLIAQSAEANAVVYEVVGRLDGSIAAEHGIGQLKPTWLAQHAPAGSMALMRQLKATLDPQGLMNPGKVLV